MDIGCGFSGILYKEYVTKHDYVYYCADISQEVITHMTELLSDQGDNDFTKIGRLEDIPWESDFFDIVYASHILEHTEDIVKAFNEIKRVLKKDGILLFAVPCGYDNEPAHVHNREKNEWKMDFKNNGWRIKKAHQFSFNQNEFYGIAKPTS